jgi:hypothetical protein
MASGAGGVSAQPENMEPRTTRKNKEKESIFKTKSQVLFLLFFFFRVFRVFRGLVYKMKSRYLNYIPNGCRTRITLTRPATHSRSKIKSLPTNPVME